MREQLSEYNIYNLGQDGDTSTFLSDLLIGPDADEGFDFKVAWLVCRPNTQAPVSERAITGV